MAKEVQVDSVCRVWPRRVWKGKYCQEEFRRVKVWPEEV